MRTHQLGGKLVTEDEVLQREPPLTPSVTPGQHDVTHRVTQPGHLAPHSTRAGSGGGGGGRAWVWVAEAEGWRRFGTELSFTCHRISRIAIFLYQAICKRRGVECLGGADDSRVVLEGTGGRWVSGGWVHGAAASHSRGVWRGVGVGRSGNTYGCFTNTHTQTIPEDVRQTWSTYAKTVTLGTRALFPSLFHSLGNTRRQQRHDCRFRCQVRHLSTSDSLGDMSLGRRRVRGHIHTLLSSISRLWDMLCCTGEGEERGARDLSRVEATHLHMLYLSVRRLCSTHAGLNTSLPHTTSRMFLHDALLEVQRHRSESVRNSYTHFAHVP